MIQYIHGTLCEISDGMIIVEAGGIGYGINVPSSVIGELPAVGTEVRIYTYYSVKEDSQSLFGFLYKEDREMFVQLIGVNGIGPKGALAILSALKPDDLRMAIITGDAKAISSAQGIGKKTAERVVLELRDKIAKLEGIHQCILNWAPLGITWFEGNDVADGLQGIDGCITGR